MHWSFVPRLVGYHVSAVVGGKHLVDDLVSEHGCEL